MTTFSAQPTITFVLQTIITTHSTHYHLPSSNHTLPPQMPRQTLHTPLLSITTHQSNSSLCLLHDLHLITTTTPPPHHLTTTSDPDTRRLECGAVQRDGKDEPLGLLVLCCSHDLRQLCPLQPAGGHPGRGLLC